MPPPGMLLLPCGSATCPDVLPMPSTQPPGRMQDGTRGDREIDVYKTVWSVTTRPNVDALPPDGYILQDLVGLQKFFPKFCEWPGRQGMRRQRHRRGAGM